MSDLDALFNFEETADRKAKELDIWQLPLRSVVTSLYLSADSLYSGVRFTRQNKPRPQHGTAVFSRASYLAQLFQTCSLDIGADIDDAMSVIDERIGHQVADALAYAHFCEIMPEARKGFYTVEATETGFKLHHPSDAFAQSEERDILLTELSLAFDTHQAPFPGPTFDRMIVEWPKLNGADFIEVLGGGKEHYLSVFRESALLSEDAYQTGFGFSRNEFQRVRAALMSIADFCLGMAAAAERRWQSASRLKRIRWEKECREWAAPLLSRNFILGVTQELAGVSSDTIDRVITYLSMDANQGDFQNAGDGYLPPFISLGDAFLFSPYALKAMLPERNLLYVLNKRDRTTFNNLVSVHLEPTLLDEAAELFSQIPGVEVAKNVNWNGGEIDLLVFQPTSKVALHIQAKAALPPEGARMTHQVESQTLKAVDQIKRFEQTPDSFRDQLCAKIFKREATALTWVSGVLSRSSLGTAKAWCAAEGLAIFNPLLLRGAVSQIISNPKLSLSDLPTITQHLIHELTDQTVKGWHHEKIKVFGVEIDIPLLDLDNEEIANTRRRWFNQVSPTNDASA